jgi:hypothetical protein
MNDQAISDAGAPVKRSDPLKALSGLLPGWILPLKLRVFFQLVNAILFQYGWLRSLRCAKAVDAQGNPLPWITYPAIDFLAELDLSEKSVFEWGAGQSTLFWATRAAKIVSVETERDWYQYVSKTAPQNCELLLSEREVELYASLIEKYSEGFDVILIDGPGDFRPACSRKAIDHLKAGGIIILDNSDQCLNSARILRESGLIQVDFAGFAPGQGYATTTSIFFDRRYSFQPLAGIQPHKSVAQPNPPWADA